MKTLHPNKQTRLGRIRRSGIAARSILALGALATACMVCAIERPRDDEAMIFATNLYKGTVLMDKIAETFATNFIPRHTNNYFRGMDAVAVPLAGPSAITWPDQLLDKDVRPARRLMDIAGKARGSNGDYVDSMALQSEVFGRNTWMIWCGGNETFWDWLANNSLGFMDLIKLLDSRTRATRWRDGGIVNEPGMRETSAPQTNEFGLWLDQPENELERAYRRQVMSNFVNGANQLDFPTGYDTSYDSNQYSNIPPWRIYGLSSGVVGLRLFPNPAFQGEVRKKWNPTNYYTKTNYYSDPNLIRPFRVGMSCAFCHASAHPLNPPQNPAEPRWENLSGSIGSQYLRIRQVFGNLLPKDSFVYHLLDSQPPGTIDTSLIASDNINNPNTMNGIFGVPQRVQRAMANPVEVLTGSISNLPVLFSDPKNPFETNYRANPRPVPRILMDGADSIGVWGALARVYLNIGTYSEQWVRLHEPLVGFLPPRAATTTGELARTQLPFKIDDCQEHSVYWQATRLRVEPLRDYFLKITPSMPLLDAHGPSDVTNRVKTNLLAQGRAVFARNCIVCHSSLQPESNPWDLFESDPGDPFHANAESAEMVKRLSEYTNKWDSLAYRRNYNLTNSAAHGELWDHDPGQWLRDTDYTNWARAVVEMPEFWRNNFLSTDYRVPANYVGTNPGRALANNSTKGHMWEDFSSESYKTNGFPGSIKYFNPYAGTNGETELFMPRHRVADGVPLGGGGPGFYRPATLMSIWATAPFLHNNSLGLFNNDPSVRGRMAAFTNAIRMLLWEEERCFNNDHTSTEQWKKDHGLIWRTPSETYITIPARQVPAFVRRLPWPSSLERIAVWLEHLGQWKLLPSALLLVLAWWLLRASKDKKKRLAQTDAPDEVASRDKDKPAAEKGVFDEVASRRKKFWLRASGYASVLLAIFVGFGISFLGGRLGDVTLGPIPAGTPVNLLANINPDAGIPALRTAIGETVQGLTELQTRQLQGAKRAEVFRKKIVPALLKVSKCPDFVMDKGHFFPWFKDMTPEEKEALIELLKTF
jgi:hypothetical protein